MEKLSKDILIYLALDLDLPSLLNLCRTDKKMNKGICESNTFWMSKLYKHYPHLKGKLPLESDYKKIYQSLYNKERFSYYVFKSNCDEDDQPPKFWSFIKKREKHDRSNPITEEDFKLAEQLYPDFMDRCGEDFRFDIIGDFPKGTEIWLAYSDDRDLNLREGYLSKNEAIDSIIKNIERFLTYFYYEKEELEEANGRTIEQIYGYKTKEEILNSFRRELFEKGYINFFSMDDQNTYWYVIKNFEIVDYPKMLRELKKRNPDWNKLPKDMINYILKELK